MRLIDVDALINTLQELYDKRDKEARFTGDRGVTVTWNDAIYHIKTDPTIEPQRWIPVSERLPEENQICIVTDETMRNTYEYRFCKETYDENQGWTYLKHRIIAWMPLPEPYRSEA